MNLRTSPPVARLSQRDLIRLRFLIVGISSHKTYAVFHTLSASKSYLARKSRVLPYPTMRLVVSNMVPSSAVLDQVVL